MENPFEEAARTKKAGAIANFIWSLGHGTVTAENLTAPERRAVERAAGVRFASDVTWSEVFALLTSHENVRARFEARMIREGQEAS